MFFEILISLVPWMTYAGVCGGPNITGKLLVQRKIVHQTTLLEKSRVPESCGSYISQDPNDVGLGMVREVGQSVAETLFQSAAPVATLMFAGAVPDPDAERLERLDQAVACLHDSLEELKGDVKELQDQVVAINQILQIDWARDLHDMSRNLRLQTQDHTKCARLMECVAGVKYATKIGTGNAYNTVTACEDYLKIHEGINELEEACNSEKFYSRFSQSNHYNFVTQDLDDMTKKIDMVITDSSHQFYSAVYGTLTALNLLVMEYLATWSAIERWAEAICYPWTDDENAGITDSPCEEEDVRFLERGIEDFKVKYHMTFVGHITTFKEKMTTSDFIQTRQQSKAPVTLRKNVHYHCFVLDPTYDKYEKCGGGQLSSCCKRTHERYETRCERITQHENELCEGNVPCEPTEENPQYGCTYKSCGDCQRGCYAPIRCDCGLLDCPTETESSFHYDHMGIHFEFFMEAYNVLIDKTEKFMTQPPPYHLQTGQEYPLTWDFTPKLLPGKKVALKGGKEGKYYCADVPKKVICQSAVVGPWEICADVPEKLICQSAVIGPWEIFTVVDAGNGKIALQGGRGGKICADEGNNVRCNREIIGPWETFTEEYANPAKIALKGGNHKKYCADEGDRIVCDRDEVRSWEKFIVEEMPSVVDVGENPFGKLGLCQGDCDSDENCQSGLKCFQRHGFTLVPGCGGVGTKKYDYCYNSTNPMMPELKHIDETFGNPITQKLGLCSGDCDSDSECEDGLACFQRDDQTLVPGCSGEGQKKWDFCYQPVLNDLGLDPDTEEGLGRCVGDCDTDEDCADGLKCKERRAEDPFEPVPGCLGQGAEEWDYCYKPE